MNIKTNKLFLSPPNDYIGFLDPNPSSPRATLSLKKSIDRESDDIKDLDGVLTYTVTVADGAGNSNSETVRYRKATDRSSRHSKIKQREEELNIVHPVV